MIDKHDPKAPGAVAVVEVSDLDEHPSKNAPLLEIPGIDEPWPDDLAMATSLASEEHLSSIWDAPEEEVSWQPI